METIRPRTFTSTDWLPLMGVLAITGAFLLLAAPGVWLAYRIENAFVMFSVTVSLLACGAPLAFLVIQKVIAHVRYGTSFFEIALFPENECRALIGTLTLPPHMARRKDLCATLRLCRIKHEANGPRNTSVSTVWKGQLVCKPYMFEQDDQTNLVRIPVWFDNLPRESEFCGPDSDAARHFNWLLEVEANGNKPRYEARFRLNDTESIWKER